MKTLNELAVEVHKNAIEHGWWEEQRTFGDLISLCHSELSEALEEFRDGHMPNELHYGAAGKPEGVPSELADVIIRILDICGHYNIDLDEAMADKLDYNKTRPYRHGGKLLQKKSYKRKAI